MGQPVVRRHTAALEFGAEKLERVAPCRKWSPISFRRERHCG
jgi:hypothetical protein